MVILLFWWTTVKQNAILCFKIIFCKKNIIPYFCPNYRHLYVAVNKQLKYRIMRTFLLSLAILISATAFAQVPSVTVENAKGEAVNTKTLLDEGTPMIVSFWSTTCKPCILELDAVYDALPDWKEEADFRVVAVATDDSRMLAKAKSFSEGRGWAEDFVLLFDKNKDFMRAMNVSVVPHVFVIDGKGKIVYSHTSYTPGSELELLEAIKKCSK